jgi:site-specific DNA-adenine methylase
MGSKLKKKILDGTIFNIIAYNLIELYNKVKDDPNLNKKDIKILAYHTISYFQYLNFLGVHQAVELYKGYILSDGKKNL